MQITSLCPKCQNRYQFDSALVGQKIRCTNKECREVFEVREAPAEEPPARVKTAPRDRRAPTFEGDSGANLPTHADAEPREADWSKMPPPPVRSREPIEEAAVARDRASADEVLAFMGLAPKTAEDDYTLPAEGEVVEEVEEVHEATSDGGGEVDYDSYLHGYRKPKRGWIKFAALGMAILLVGGGLGAVLYMKQARAKNETALAELAEQDMSSKSYKQAIGKFDELMKKYANSKSTGKYKVLKRHCQVIDAAMNPGEVAVKRRDEIVKYLAELRDSTDANIDLVRDRQPEMRDALVRIAEDQVRDIREKRVAAKEFKEAREEYVDAEKTQAMIKQYTPPNIQPPVPTELVKKYAELNELIEKAEAFEKFLTYLREKLATGLNPALVTSLEKEAADKGYATMPEVVKMLADAKLKLRGRIVFIAGEYPAKPEPVGGLVSLLIGANTDAKVEGNKVVFAAARGVLFALSEGRGQILWATRMGIDSVGLPLRIPAAGRTPEAILVPTANGQGLVAREAFTGKFIWYQELPSPIRGQPMLIDRRLYVPLTDEKGTIVMMESRDGAIRGRLELGQRIGPGGTFQESNGRIFLPADSQNVYVLDTNQEQPLVLVAMLATNHGPGSLRGEPVVIGGGADDAGQADLAYLVLPVSDGFNSMKLRSFEIPVKIDDKSVAVAGPEVSLQGWSWFPPVCDQEKIALVTDSGVFALFGVNQKQNQDPALFPMLIEQPKAGTANPGRGLVVHAEESEFWYLANGELNHKVKGWDKKEGLRLASRWRAPLKLGTPLHAGQVSADRTTLFVVTQSTSPPAWLATAVNAHTGEIRWQQSLGLAVQGDPIKLGEFIYQLDQGAGLYLVDPKQTVLPKGQEWPQGGHVLLKPRTDVVGEPVLLPTGDGKSAYLVYSIADGKTLHAIPIVAGQKPGTPIVTQLVAPLAGQPLLTGSMLLMALADGALHRWTIGEKDAKRGPDWRDLRSGESARAFITALGKDDILVSDGQRGLTLYSWPANAEPRLKQQQPIKLPDRIISAPLALPVKDGPPRIAVADAGGRLNLLEGDPLSQTMKWEMRPMKHGNEITAGPFLIDDKGQPRILVVVDRNRLVCLSPDEPRELWFYRCKGDGIEARPRPMGDMLILADLSGRFEAIESATGKSDGAVYPAQGALPAAPAAAPIEFGPSHLFAPMTDGTVLLIPIEAVLPKK